ncbi:hypothetical protein MGLY_15340 [Neomoorella glycerini]|uniref:Uncharacterized protein n=2 Tax=Neomoorella glycerini TaxID=55779 RepID=A0A6I5ZQQ8_9FIRM|nr:hypothetical protein MGLY_15340 [Moorella glycerini]
MMTWEEVRRLFPNKYIQVEILKSHPEGNKEVVEEVAIKRIIKDPQEATYTLIRSKGNTLVYHTSNEKFELEVRTRPGLRGVI